MRNTFATRLRTSNIEIQSIRDLLGHTSTRMTERYSHATASHLRAAVDKLSLTTASPMTHRLVTPLLTPASLTRTSRRKSPEKSSVPGGIRTHVTGVKVR